jgi:hypothetical protein
MSQDPSKINSTKPIVPSVTSIKREVSQNDACKRIAEMTGYLVHCANCSVQRSSEANTITVWPKTSELLQRIKDKPFWI